MHGTSHRAAWRHTFSVCGSTPGNGVEQQHRTVEHAQRTLDFDGEIGVARRIDEGQRNTLVSARDRSRRDRDALGPLLGPSVGRGVPRVDVSNAVNPAGVKTARAR